MTTAATKAPEEMSVSELRVWLQTFGKKQQEHYQQGQVRRRSPIKTGRLSVRDRAFGFEKRLRDPNDADSEPEINSQQENDRPGTRALPSKRLVTQSSQENHAPVFQHKLPFENEKPKTTLGKPGPTSSAPSFESLEPPVEKSSNSDEQSFEPILSQVVSFEDPFENEGVGVKHEERHLPDLCLTLSAMSMASSSSSVQAEASESVSEDAFQPFEAEQQEGSEDDKTEQAQPTLQRKAVPEDFSDFEPFDLDSSHDEASDDSEKGEKDNDTPTSNLWPKWNGSNVHQFLKKQNVPSLQGYWSDTNQEYEDDDDDTVGSGLRTEPSGFRFGYGRVSRKKTRKGCRGPTRLETQYEDSASGFSLIDAAKDSVQGLNRFFSERFSPGRKKSPREQAPDSPANQSMHSANLFQDKTLTSSTLDIICNGRVRPTSEYQRSNLEEFLERGGDQGSVASWSADSGKPSIAPNAVDPKLTMVFSESFDGAGSDDGRNERRQINQTRPSPIADERQDPPSPERHPQPQPTEIAPITPSSSSEQFSGEVSPASGGFASVMERFGGGGGRKVRKSRIALQKEALEEKWASSRQPQYVKKSKWMACRKSGTYKKKVFLDYK
jgi:hypothetical protein